MYLAIILLPLSYCSGVLGTAVRGLQISSWSAVKYNSIGHFSILYYYPFSTTLDTVSSATNYTLYGIILLAILYRIQASYVTNYHGFGASLSYLLGYLDEDYYLYIMHISLSHLGIWGELLMILFTEYPWLYFVWPVSLISLNSCVDVITLYRLIDVLHLLLEP